MSTPNPPAFPSHGTMGELVSSGMELRDYFAAHADQPGISEVVSMAGLTYRANRVWLSPEFGQSFDEWWNSLPLSRRIELSALTRDVRGDTPANQARAAIAKATGATS